MSRQIYVCTKGEAKGLAAKFIDYLRSDAIQKQAVVDEGYFQIR
jgi:ABC-type Fe3+ transport system substrate-binding protein